MNAWISAIGMAFALAGCASYEQPAPAPVPAPNDVAKEYIELLGKGDCEGAWKLTACNDLVPPEAVTELKEDLARYSNFLTKRGWHVSVIETRVQGRGAVVIVNEDQKDGKPARDLDPWYFVMLDEGWRVLPGVTMEESGKLFVSEAEFRDFEELARWFDGRKEELDRTK